MTRETSLNAGSGLGAVLFDEPSQMAPRAVKRGTEQKKIPKYANAKKEVSGRERQEKNMAVFIDVKVVQKWRRRLVRFLLVISFFSPSQPFFLFLVFLAAAFMNGPSLRKT